MDEDLLKLLRDAVEVLSLTDNPSTWEAVHFSRCGASDLGKLLGYDIGYWGGDHFSLIAGTIVIPRWHPPAPEDFADLAAALSCLNENLLFDSTVDADEFKQFYKSKSWAETEDYDGQFCAIRVATGEEANGGEHP